MHDTFEYPPLTDEQLARARELREKAASFEHHYRAAAACLRDRADEYDRSASRWEHELDKWARVVDAEDIRRWEAGAHPAALPAAALPGAPATAANTVVLPQLQTR